MLELTTNPLSVRPLLALRFSTQDRLAPKHVLLLLSIFLQSQGTEIL